MTDKIKYINPEGLMKNPAFSQVVVTNGAGKTIYIGGQNSVNANREIVGKGNIAEQTEQIMKNLEIALESCQAGFDNLVKLNIYIVQGQDVLAAFQASQSYFAKAENPPAITAVFVAGLGNPEFLLEIEAIAFVEE
ncbi:MAG: RidA family protein [bacterium]